MIAARFCPGRRRQLRALFSSGRLRHRSQTKHSTPSWRYPAEGTAYFQRLQGQALTGNKRELKKEPLRA